MHFKLLNTFCHYAQKLLNCVKLNKQCIIYILHLAQGTQ